LGFYFFQLVLTGYQGGAGASPSRRRDDELPDSNNASDRAVLLFNPARADSATVDEVVKSIRKISCSLIRLRSVPTCWLPLISRFRCPLSLSPAR